jgi:menaquinol-cytochrome c reductase iron-sulfur subunit
MDRRSFLSALTVAAGAVGGALVGIPILGRVLAPLRASHEAAGGPTFHSLGPVDSFDAGAPTRVAFPVTVRDGWDVTVQERAAWVVKGKDGRIAVLSTVCPHLGCSVKWTARSEFGCPCHESGFAPDGARLRGPARRGLDELPSRVVAGDLQVQWVEYAANVAQKKPLGAA